MGFLEPLSSARCSVRELFLGTRIQACVGAPLGPVTAAPTPAQLPCALTRAPLVPGRWRFVCSSALGFCSSSFVFESRALKTTGVVSRAVDFSASSNQDELALCPGRMLSPVQHGALIREQFA